MLPYVYTDLTALSFGCSLFRDRRHSRQGGSPRGLPESRTQTDTSLLVLVINLLTDVVTKNVTKLSP